MFLYCSFAVERRIFQINFADGLATTLPMLGSTSKVLSQRTLNTIASSFVS